MCAFSIQAKLSEDAIHSEGSDTAWIYYARSENNVLTFFLSAHLVNCSEIESENMVQLASDLRKQYLYRTTAVLCAQCLDLSNLDNPRGTDSHIIGHAFSEPAGLIRGKGVGGCMQNRLIPSPRTAQCATALARMRWSLPACPLLEPGSWIGTPRVAHTVGTDFPAALRPCGAGARCC